MAISNTPFLCERYGVLLCPKNAQNNLKPAISAVGIFHNVNE